jgi:hypothetical protein
MKHFYLSLLIYYFLITVNSYSNDANNPQAKNIIRVTQAKSEFKRVTGKEATKENIYEILALENARGDSKYGIESAIAILQYSGEELRSIDIEKIANCAKSNPEDAGIIYNCALALEPLPVSFQLHVDLISNKSFSLTTRLLSAERLGKAAMYNKIPADIILQGLLANYKPDGLKAKRIINAVRLDTNPQGKLLYHEIQNLLQKNKLDLDILLDR